MAAVVLRVLGSEGSGGGLEEDVAVEVLVGVDMVVVELDPVSPTDALVCPALLSQGLGGDGVAIYLML